MKLKSNCNSIVDVHYRATACVAYMIANKTIAKTNTISYTYLSCDSNDKFNF